MELLAVFAIAFVAGVGLTLGYAAVQFVLQVLDAIFDF